MNAIETIAVSKMVKKGDADKARELLSVGSYEINTLVRVTGTMNVGEDYEQEFWQIAKPEKVVLALACAVNKTTADKITQEQYERVLSDVDGLVHDISDEQAKRFKKDREDSIKKLRKPCKKQAKGKVTTKLTYEVVGEEVEAPVQTEEKVKA